MQGRVAMYFALTSWVLLALSGVHSPRVQHQANSIAVTGPPGQLYARLEIRQMQEQEPDQFILLILGMAEFQAQTETKMNSYYQIAGIHGAPHQDWAENLQCENCNGAKSYCTHNSAVFPTWHRAYMALFEQEFLKIINKTASRYTGSRLPVMQHAALTMRFPFWDWAARHATFPSIFSSPEVTVAAPNGTVTIANPLYQHSFADPTSLGSSFFNKQSHTLRYPTKKTAHAESQNQKGMNEFNRIQGSLQDQTYQLLTSCETWLSFSNSAATIDSDKCLSSLESIHNLVHTVVGGIAGNGAAGHMADPAVAAFDPLFWFHHMNVDRLFAIWQALHPKAFSNITGTALTSTWSIPQGTHLNANTPLAPFYQHVNGSYWTSAGIRDWRIFNYDYPEFVGTDRSSKTISGIINQLYSPRALSARTHSSKRVYDKDVLSAPSTANSTRFQYVVGIQTPQFALNGSYNIYLFDGAPGHNDSSTWLKDTNFVGLMGVFASSGLVNHSLKTVGSVPLTRSLMAKLGKGDLKDLDETTVVLYLNQNLVCLIVAANHPSVESKQLQGFRATLYASVPLKSLQSRTEWTAFKPVVTLCSMSH